MYSLQRLHGIRLFWRKIVSTHEIWEVDSQRRITEKGLRYLIESPKSSPHVPPRPTQKYIFLSSPVSLKSVKLRMKIKHHVWEELRDTHWISPVSSAEQGLYPVIFFPKLPHLKLEVGSYVFYLPCCKGIHFSIAHQKQTFQHLEIHNGISMLWKASLCLLQCSLHRLRSIFSM